MPDHWDQVDALFAEVAELPGDSDAGAAEASHDGAPDGVRRRDFINIAAVSFAGVGGAAVLVPLVSQMAPSADVLAQSSTEIDISAIKPGQVIMRIDPRYFRPAEVETLLGDPTKAKEKLGWTPEITAQEMCAEMVAEDLKTARRHALLKQHGFGLPVSLEG